jgi:hypothetical protein
MKGSCQGDLAIVILKERLYQARCSFDMAYQQEFQLKCASLPIDG